MYEVDSVCEIVERINVAQERAEKLAISVLKILDDMECIEKMMEESTNE